MLTGLRSFSNLIKEHYLIKETKAPEGYQLSDEEIQVNAAQLKNYGSGIIYKDFTNRKALITASGTKTWNDDNDKDGKRPDKITVRLYANGTEVAHKEVGPMIRVSGSMSSLTCQRLVKMEKILSTQLLKTVFMVIQLLLMV